MEHFNSTQIPLVKSHRNRKPVLLDGLAFFAGVGPWMPSYGSSFLGSDFNIIQLRFAISVNREYLHLGTITNV